MMFVTMVVLIICIKLYVPTVFSNGLMMILAMVVLIICIKLYVLYAANGLKIVLAIVRLITVYVYNIIMLNTNIIIDNQYIL